MITKMIVLMKTSMKTMKIHLKAKGMSQNKGKGRDSATGSKGTEKDEEDTARNAESALKPRCRRTKPQEEARRD